MRSLTLLSLLCLAACGDDTQSHDAAVGEDLHVASLDMTTRDLTPLPDDLADASEPPDATQLPDMTCLPAFQGGVDPTTQGWTVYQIAPDTLSTPSAGVTQLETTTTAGAQSGGQLLLAKALVTPGQAFTLTVVAKVVAVNNHNQLDAAVAIMGSLTGQVGTQTERSEMIYVDSDKLGWGDDTSGTFLANALDGQFHTYVLKVDGAGNAVVTRDGVQALARTGYTTNGTVAVGDQTNDPNYDSTIQVQSISICGT